MPFEVPTELSSLSSRLTDYLRAVSDLPEPASVIGRLSGGWSVDTYRVRIGGVDRVLRIAGPDHPLQTNTAREAELMRRAGAAGVPVPEVFHAERDPEWLGAPFSIVELVAGAAPNVWSRRAMRAMLERQRPEVLLDRLLDLALRIQTIPTDPEPLPASIVGLGIRDYSIAADAEHWLELLRHSSGARPGLDLAGQWLAANAPPAGVVVLQHHDFRLGNIMFGPDGRETTVLDWEFAGAGDPLCDLGYAAQPYCLGKLLDSLPAIDVAPDPTSWLLERHAERAAQPAEPDRLRYFVALGMFKMAAALVLPAQLAALTDRHPREAWLELPILSLTNDLMAAIEALA